MALAHTPGPYFAGAVNPEPLRTGAIRLGMPQLSGVGLSETWLLETCGDLHWSMICDRLGAPSQELRDTLGRRVYISFVAVRVASECLNLFQEGDLLRYSSSLTQRSATRFESVHRWVCGSRAVDVEMLSVFLCRRTDGENALEEAQVAAPLQSKLGSPPSDLERAFRRQLWSRASRPAIPHACTWQPSLALDYNGARLLYFARYHQILERAEVSVFGESVDDCYSLERRETYYFANLNPGESITVGLAEVLNPGPSRCYQAEIRRSRDGRLMARIATRKKRCGAAGGR